MDEPAFDVAACLERVRRRDEDAARAMVEHLYPLVIKIVRSHLPRTCTEEDLAQEVFMKMFSRLGQYRGEMPFEHWVSRVAHNTCIDRLRSQQRRPELRWSDLSEEQAAVLEAAMGADRNPDSIEALAARDLVETLLECLKPEDRLVITLLDLEQLSVAEIRERTGWNASLIKVRAFRARRKLKNHLQTLKEHFPHE